MESEEWIDQIWQQIGRLEVRHVQLKRELDKMKQSGGLDSPESEVVAMQIKELRECLLRLDEEYSNLLRNQI